MVWIIKKMMMIILKIHDIFDSCSAPSSDVSMSIAAHLVGNKMMGGTLCNSSVFQGWPVLHRAGQWRCFEGPLPILNSTWLGRWHLQWSLVLGVPALGAVALEDVEFSRLRFAGGAKWSNVMPHGVEESYFVFPPLNRGKGLVWPLQSKVVQLHLYSGVGHQRM